MARPSFTACPRFRPARSGRRVGVSALSVFKKSDPKMIEFAMKGL
jgi:hypothetical protein